MHGERVGEGDAYGQGGCVRVAVPLEPGAVWGTGQALARMELAGMVCLSGVLPAQERREGRRNGGEGRRDEGEGRRGDGERGGVEAVAQLT